MRWALVPATLCAMAQAQQTIGHVALRDAAVTGTLDVEEGQATLRGGASIVARDHTAELALNRGGAVRVCSTSSLHVTSGTSVGESTPLLFALDRGAIELKTLVGARDVLITPDLRFSTLTGGRVDLRVRVTSNGDTCVENRGPEAPTIEVVEQFGDGHYEVRSGQHLLFEHGNIREVVDRESSPCGCPPVPVTSLAENGVSVAPGEAARVGGKAAQTGEEHPFPAAQSQGLAEASIAHAAQPAPRGEARAQVAATMAYGGGRDSTETEAKAATAQPPAAAAQPLLSAPGGGGAGGGSAATPRTSTSARSSVPARNPQPGTSPSAPPASTSAQPPQNKPVEVKAPPPPAPPGATDIAHRIGRFFKRIFGAGGR